ncbi:hypothetical protein GGG16DRAFT_129229 [Schizophyllum commune]
MSRRLRNPDASGDRQTSGAASLSTRGVSPDMSSRRSHKRKTEDTDARHNARATNKKAKLAFTKHEWFWLLDGNIMVQIGDIRFRLHRSRLASQSPWFEALFEKHAGGNPKVEAGYPDLDEVVVEEEDGMDVVYLDSTKVTSDDFAKLLTAMDDAIEYYMNTPSVPVLAAIVRASSILCFPKFRVYAVKTIADLYSDDLDEFDDEFYAYATDVVNLGRTHNLPHLLKKAMYDLARDCEFDAKFLEDETPLHALSPRDLCLILTAQKRLALEWQDVITLDKEPYKCKNANCRSDSKTHSWAVIHSNDGVRKKYTTDPICGMQALINLDWTAHGHCDACQTWRRNELTERRKKLWADLDKWLEIEVPAQDGEGGGEGDGGCMQT